MKSFLIIIFLLVFIHPSYVNAFDSDKLALKFSFASSFNAYFITTENEWSYASFDYSRDFGGTDEVNEWNIGIEAFYGILENTDISLLFKRIKVTHVVTDTRDY